MARQRKNCDSFGILIKMFLIICTFAQEHETQMLLSVECCLIADLNIEECCKTEFAP